MRNKYILFILVSICISVSGFSEEIEAAQNFYITSGDGKTTSLAEYKGKLVVCFYESRDTENDNISFKNYLRSYNYSDNNIEVLAIADCSSVPWFLKSIWENALLKRSSHYGYIVYGDWDGKMKKSYGFSEKANFMIIDKSQKIRYKKIGVISDFEFESIMQLIVKILGE